MASDGKAFGAEPGGQLPISQPQPPQPQANSGAVTTLPPSVFIMVQPSENKNNSEYYAKHFPKKTVLVLSSLQCVVCLLTIIFQIVVIVESRYGVGDVGTGIWCGVFFGISGGLGLMAAHKPSLCPIVAFMVMSIISACFCLPLLVISCIGVGDSRRRSYYSEKEDYTVLCAFFGLQALMSIIQATLAITSSALSCKATCCRTNNPGTVVYNPANAQNFSLGQIQTGYVTVPMNPGGNMPHAAGLPTAAAAPAPVLQAPPVPAPEEVSKEARAQGGNLPGYENSPPPKYEEARLPGDDDDTNKGGKYYRFS